VGEPVPYAEPPTIGCRGALRDEEGVGEFAVARRRLPRLWGAQTVSKIGSQVSGLALPLVAILSLHATTFQVAALGTDECMTPTNRVHVEAGPAQLP
jgi:hypothetical protein